MRTFTPPSGPDRVVFGRGTLTRTRAEVERLGRRRILVLASRSTAEAAMALEESLGPLAVARFDGAVMHTPTEVTEKALDLALEHAADCVVAVGGGSTTGLAKALAARVGVDQVILPTTYAGSEMTAVLGETTAGVKRTRSGPEVLPEVVIYDVDLTLGLPLPLTVTSAANALAHAVEALYSPQATPATDAMALQAVGDLAAAIAAIVADPHDPGVREKLLEAAWLAGTCLGAVGMGLHHQLCHILGGAFALNHAATHAVILPHAMAYNASAVPEVMARIARAIGVTDAPSGVHDLLRAAGAPASLRELGLAQSDLAGVAGTAARASYPNPRRLDVPGVAALLDNAWHGRRPAGTAAELSLLTTQVLASFDATPNPRARRLLRDLVWHLHRFAIGNDLTEAEWRYGIDFLTRAGQITDDNRQEFILLSDTLGLSSVVDVLGGARTPESTPSAVLGPFYCDDPPDASHGTDLAKGMAGTPVWADLRVVGPGDRPIPGARVDVWQSDDQGLYDVQNPDLPEPQLRARFFTGSDGRLVFWTILPSEYPIPDDGPVGQMLAAVGRHPFRAPHIHFLIDAPGHRRLVTQLFVAGGEHLDSDTVFGVKEPLVAPFERGDGPAPGGRRVTSEWRRLTYTFRLARGPHSEAPGNPASLA
ncbi:maleylacetate reductase and hydroxyquinol 1,2-dioxygenase domain-containing protein [Nonomuraea sp. NPDC050022]|uniref:maleylacetate reductase and hydroxyquinol 1,2-dioxygenase domain-containing protein n=1 Tax=Nonomuraea sp. NPDC050022 TaxID=3364358 RepID=UPI0037AEBA61